MGSHLKIVKLRQVGRKKALVKAYEKEEAKSKQRKKDRLVTKYFAKEESLQTLPHYEPPVQHSSFDPQELSTT